MSVSDQTALEEPVGIDEPYIDVRVMRHDLQAQLINTKGLNREIGDVTKMIKQLLEKEQKNLPDSFTSRMMELVEEDLEPCVKFQDQATDALDKLMSGYLETISKIARH